MAGNTLLRLQCPDVGEHTQLSLTAINAAIEPREGQSLVSAFLVLQEEGGGQTVRWWEILSKPRSSLEDGGGGGAGHPALPVGTGRGRWIADRKGVYPCPFAVMTQLFVTKNKVTK